MFKIIKMRMLWFFVVALMTIGIVESSALAQKRVIRFVTDENEIETVEAYRLMEQRFEEEYPQYDLQIEIIADADVWPKLITSLVAGNPPEVAYVDADTVVKLAAEEYLYDVSELVEEIGKGGLGDFYSSMLSLVQQDGAILGVPDNTCEYFMLYRKSLFEEAGISVPTRWNEYVDSLAKITSKTGMRGINIHMGAMQGLHFLVSQLWSNGGYMFARPDGTCVLDMLENIEALDYLKKLWEFTAPAAAGDTYADAYMRFVNEELVTAWAYGRTFANIDRYNPEIADDVGSAFLPKPDGFRGNYVTHIWPVYLVVFKDAREIEGAKEFIKFYMRPEEQIPILASVPPHLLPARRSVGNMDMFLNHPNIRKHREALELQVKYLPYARQIAFEHGAPCYKSARLTTAPVLLDVMYKALVDGVSSEEALKWGVQETEALLSP